jgi:SAM-dependent methyltransferase
MSTLASKPHWDSVHTGEQRRFLSGNLTTEALRLRGKDTITAGIKKLLGNHIVERMSGYDDYLLWDVILPNALPSLKGAKVLEIGSAPGEYSVEFSKRHGCIPYGVEYSDVGVEVNREVFKQNGFNPDNVIHADFFSEEFTAEYRNKFDAVISKGFVEHFEDVKYVIEKHLHVLRPGGHLVVTIPNLWGVNNVFARFFDENAIPRHNVSIMRKAVYGELFTCDDLQRIFCDYYGTFSFYLFTAGRAAFRKHVLKISHRFQPVLNLALRTIFQDRGAESGLFSPFLLYIGKKTN